MSRSHSVGYVAPLIFALFVSATPALNAQGRNAGGQALDIAGLEVAAFEDYRTAVGRMMDGTLRVALEAREAAWYPCVADGQGLRAHGEALVTWRHVAKDGADLPDGQVRDVPANLRIHVGETYDFLWAPDAGEYTLSVLTTFDRGAPAFPREAPAPETQELIVRVR